MKSLIYILLLALLFGCSTTDRLTPFLQAEVDRANGVIRIIDYNKVKWDRLYVVGPYTTARSFDNLLVKYKKEIEATGIDSSDHFCILLLFYEGKLVSLSKVDRGVVDFYKGVKTTGLTVGYYDKTTAIFNYRIDAETGGTRRIIENEAKQNN